MEHILGLEEFLFNEGNGYGFLFKKWLELPKEEIEKGLAGVIEIEIPNGNKYRYELTDKKILKTFKELVGKTQGKSWDLLKKWSLNILKYDPKSKKWEIIDR